MNFNSGKLWPLTLHNFEVKFSHGIELKNNGHSGKLNNSYFLFKTYCHTYIPITAAFHLPQDHTSVPYISGCSLDGYYYFSSGHFHWGADNFKGSEHALNGQKYDAEMHLIFKQEQTGDLAVLGIFLDKDKVNRHIFTSS